MTTRIAAIFSYILLGAFLAILGWSVPEIDLIAVMILTLGLAGYDLWRNVFSRKS